jgi:hypothetical protein
MSRILRYAFSTLLVLVLVGGPALAQVTDEVSSYTKVRRVKSAELKDIAIKKYPGNDAALMAEYESDPEAGETTWALSFYGFASEPTSVSSAQEVIIVADGSPVQPLRVESKSRSIDGDIIEIKKAYFSRPIFQRLASAETMKVTIGAAVFEVSPRAREDMQTILDKIPAQDGRRTASTDGSNRR